MRGARALAHRMGLAHFTLDLRDEFRAGVVEPWLAGHADGLTPNPCVRCNGHVRLDAMLDFADRLGAATLATGHYARAHAATACCAAPPTRPRTRRYMLAALAPRLARPAALPARRPADQARRSARSRARPACRSRARPTRRTSASSPARAARAFLARHGGLRERPGDIVDRAGRRLGRHRGHHHFTVGQRRGLGIGGEDEPLYVLATDARANTVTVGPRDGARDDDRRASAACACTRDAAEVDAVKLRYRAPAVACTPRGRRRLSLAEPVHGAAPGQIACLLRGDVVVGCATIVA